MKKNYFNHLVPFLVIIAFVQFSFSQDKLHYEPSIDPLVKGEEYLNEGENEKAFEQFDKVHEGDSLFFRFAVHLKMAALNRMEDYSRAKAIGDKYWYFRHELPTEFYLNYGTALDKLEKYDESQRMYESILKEYPLNYSLWYNLGISHSLEGDHDKAYETFKKTIEINPFYDRVHLGMARLAFAEQQTSKGLLAIGRYLMHSITKRNNFPQLRYGDYMASSKYWDDEDFSGSNGLDLEGNDGFESIDQLVHNYVALRDKYKTPSKLDYALVKQIHLVATQLKDQKLNDDNFWHKTYGKFYKEMLEEDQFEGFSYLISSFIENEEMQKIVKRKDKDLVGAYEWAVKYLNDENQMADLSFIGFGKTKVSRSGELHYVEMIGDYEVKNNGQSLVGDVVFYGEEGRKTAQGTFNSNGKKEGQWKYYHSNGRLKEKQLMEDGKGVDTSYVYYANGLLNLKIPYKQGVPNGDVLIYANGVLTRSLPYKDGSVSTGKFKDYHPIGTIDVEYEIVNGKANGPFVSFFDTGEKYREGEYKDGNLEGERVTYYRTGDVSYKENFNEDELNGDYISYYRNGQIEAQGVFEEGNKVGSWEYFYQNGNKRMIQNFDERGKENGLETNYTKSGRKVSEISYSKGIIDAYKFFAEDGSILSEDERKGGDLNFVGYYSNGLKSAEGIINKEGRHGEWKFYFVNGALKSIQNYENGTRKGTYEKYFPNGTLEIKYAFNDQGLSEGYYRNYYRNGDLFRQGYLQDGDRDGPWASYHRNGNISSESFNSGSELQGFYTSYDVKGKPYRSTYYEDGLGKFDIYYDTTGVAFDTIFNMPGKRIEQLRRCAECPPFLTVDVVNNKYHGDQVFEYPDGTLEAKGPVFNGSKHGDWQTFHTNGELASEGKYVDGSKHGVWKYYSRDGYMFRKVNYVYGDLHGEYENYDEDGDVVYEVTYFYGDKHGESKYYVGKKHDHSRTYNYGNIESYTYTTAEGKKVTENMVDETAKVASYWENGKIARKYEIKNGWFEGPYLKYYDNGQIAEDQTYENDLLVGEYKEYYRNGKLKLKANYVEGEIDGVYYKYYENGSLKSKEQYVEDELYGKATYFNEDGSVKTIIHYVNGNVISIDKK